MCLTILPVDQGIRHALKIADYVHVLELGRNKFQGPAVEFTIWRRYFGWRRRETARRVALWAPRSPQVCRIERRPWTDSSLVPMNQNTTARRIGWVESNVLSNSFSNSRVK